MRYWIAKNAAKTRMRIQEEPFQGLWTGWEIREGDMTDEQWAEFSEDPIDPIQLEVIHQDAWVNASRPAVFSQTRRIEVVIHDLT